jgi:hypothetical protein
MDTKMMSISDAAKHIGVSEYFMRQLVKGKKVNACRIGTGKGKILVNLKSVEEYFNKCILDENDDDTAPGDDYDITPIDVHIK